MPREGGNVCVDRMQEREKKSEEDTFKTNYENEL